MDTNEFGYEEALREAHLLCVKTPLFTLEENIAERLLDVYYRGVQHGITVLAKKLEKV